MNPWSGRCSESITFLWSSERTNEAKFTREIINVFSLNFLFLHKTRSDIFQGQALIRGVKKTADQRCLLITTLKNGQKTNRQKVRIKKTKWKKKIDTRWTKRRQKKKRQKEERQKDKRQTLR